MVTTTLILLCIAAFAAGFVDAIVGGGGLIQTPVGLILMPQFPIATVIGSLKIPAFSGTAIAAKQYAKKVKLNWNFLLPMMAVAMLASFAGSTLLTMVSNSFMKPVLLGVLTVVAIYTFMKKDFGTHSQKNHTPCKTIFLSILISLTIGFYDGFIGPGAGSFLVMGFIILLGFDFLKASANAKMVNLATNFGSICLFIIKGKILWQVALPMAACNAAGGFVGAKLAISKGNKFIRVFFLIVVVGTLIRFAYDVFYKN